MLQSPPTFSTLTDYEARYLAHHLSGANAFGWWRWLLRQPSQSGSNAWFELKFSRGMLTSFFEDLDLTCGKDASTSETTGAPLDIQIRAALYRTIGGTLGSIDISLIKDLRVADIWTSDQVRDVLALRRSIEQRELSSTDLSPDDARTVSDAIFARAIKGTTIRDKAYSLKALLSVLSEEQRSETFQAMLRAARPNSEYNAPGELLHPGSNLLGRVRLLLAVAKESERPKRVALALEALSLAKSMGVANYGDTAVREVGELGDAELVEPILKAISQWRGTPVSLVLMTLAKQATATEREVYLERALDELEEEEWSELKFIALEDLVMLLPSRLLNRAMILARTLEPDDERAPVLTALAKRDDWESAGTAVREAIAAIAVMRPSGNMWELLSSLGARIPPECLSTVRESLSRLGDAYERAIAFAEVFASAWPSGERVLAEACWKNARRVSQGKRLDIVKRIHGIASKATGAVQVELMKLLSRIADSISDPAVRASAASAQLEPHPETPLDIQRRLRAVIFLNDKKGRVSAQLALLACLFDKSPLGAALNGTSLGSVDESSRLTRVYRSIHQNRGIARDAWAVLRGLSLLTGSGVRLRDVELISFMISVAEAIEKPLERAEALASLARWCTSHHAELFQKSRDAIRKIDDIKERIEALIALATVFGEEKPEEIYREAEQLISNMDTGDGSKDELARWLTHSRLARNGQRSSDIPSAPPPRWTGIKPWSTTDLRGPASFSRQYLNRNGSSGPSWSHELSWLDGPTYIRALGALAVRLPEKSSELLTEALGLALDRNWLGDDPDYLEALLAFGEPAKTPILTLLRVHDRGDYGRRGIRFALKHFDEGRKMLDSEKKRLVDEMTNSANRTHSHSIESYYSRLAGRVIEIVPLMDEADRLPIVSQLLNSWQADKQPIPISWLLPDILPYCRPTQSDLLIRQMIDECRGDARAFLRIVATLIRAGETAWVSQLRDEAVDQLEHADRRTFVDHFPELITMIDKSEIDQFIARIDDARALCRVIEVLAGSIDLSLIRSCTSNFDGFRGEERAIILAAAAVYAHPTERGVILDEAIQEALQVYDESVRRKTLLNVFERVLRFETKHQMRPLRMITSESSETKRNELFNRIVAAKDSIAAVAGRDAIGELICAIEECCEWWP